MSIKSKLLITTAALAVGSSVAHADVSADQLAAAYADYDYVEIKTGLSQLKVEATNGNRTLEVIYDISTGEILKSEVEAAGDNAGRVGVEFDREDEDFLDDDERDDEDDDERDDERDDEDDDEDEDEDEDDDDEDDEDDE